MQNRIFGNYLLEWDVPPLRVNTTEALLYYNAMDDSAVGGWWSDVVNVDPRIDASCVRRVPKFVVSVEPAFRPANPAEEILALPF